MNSTIIDISWPLTATTTCYKDRQCIQIDAAKTFEVDQVRESKIIFGSHIGTHIDAPSHFLADGASIDQVPLSTFVGLCTVLDLTKNTEKITCADLDWYQIAEGDILLFKTQNSMYAPTDRFDYNFVYLDQSAADYLVLKKIKAVGIDYIGIERNQPHHETHLALMQAQIGILEGLRLAHVAPGSYTLIALPLLLPGIDAAPARAILMR